MKKKLLLAAFVGLQTALFSQTPSGCTIPANLAAAYDQDVKTLAVLRMRAVGDPAQNQVEVPQIHQDSILRGLSAILNNNSGYGDSILNIHCIHHFADNGYTCGQNVAVGLDTNFTWTRAWLQGQTTTGNAGVDSLMARYGFSVNGGLGVLQLAYLTTSSGYYNLEAFCQELEQFGGVRYASPNGGLGDADEIEYTVLPSGNQQFIFTKKWGDCPSGCINYRQWTVSVSPNCTDALIGRDEATAGPEPEPTPPNCNLRLHSGVRSSEQLTQRFELLPNPARDQVQVRFGTNELIYLTVSNLHGQILERREVIAQTELDLTRWPKGVYFLHARDTQARQTTQKLVVE